MEIRINDYLEPDHFRALNEDNYNLSRSCEYEKNEMHHIHETAEILLVEQGCADYYIAGKKYSIEPGDILIIGPREHHMRRLYTLPFLRYGISIKPAYYRSLNLGEDLIKIFQTPSPEQFIKCFKNVEKNAFNEIIHLMEYLYGETGEAKSFSPLLERCVFTEIAIILYRISDLKPREINAMYSRMMEVREYIDVNYKTPIDLQTLSEMFFLHPVTISKEFNKAVGQSITKYINSVRICEGARLLENTDMNVTEIALECGYDNVNTFIRQFKIIVETTPLQYRKSIHEWQNRFQNKHHPLII